MEGKVKTPLGTRAPGEDVCNVYSCAELQLLQIVAGESVSYEYQTLSRHSVQHALLHRDDLITTQHS